MSRLSPEQVHGRLRCCAMFLCLLATWTLVIKYLNPLCMTWAEARLTGHGSGPFFLWDFWWVPHLLLAFWFWRRLGFAWEFGMVVSVVEIIIIVVKFAGFFKNPSLPRTQAPPLFDAFLTNNWFINKVFVLAFFVYLLSQLLRPEFKAFLSRIPKSTDPST